MNDHGPLRYTLPSNPQAAMSSVIPPPEVSPSGEGSEPVEAAA